MIRSLVVLVALGTTTAAAQDPAPVLARARNAYRQIDTYQAQFTQIIHSDVFGSDTTNGNIYIAKPDRFAMRFIEPAGDRLIVDGQWFWVFTPSSTPDQVIRTDVPQSGPMTHNLFAQFVERPAERYVASRAGTGSVDGKSVQKVRLVPRNQDMGFSEATIYIGLNDGLIRGMELIEETGQKRVLTFHGIRLNDPVPNDEVSFTPPSGVRVVIP
jgi:outer membrane lipoprotein carrier protein